MPRRRNLARDVAELAVAAPTVVAHRLARIAAADHPEMHRMGAEKVAAFWESWAAMGWQVVALQQRSWIAFQAACWRNAWFPWAAWRPETEPWTGTAEVWQRNLLQIAQHGLAPVHRRALANARRLGQPRG